MAEFTTARRLTSELGGAQQAMERLFSVINVVIDVLNIQKLEQLDPEGLAICLENAAAQLERAHQAQAVEGVTLFN